MTKIEAVENLIANFTNARSVIYENVVSNQKYSFDNGCYIVIGCYFDTNTNWFEFNGKRFNLTKAETRLLREVVSLNYGKILYF